MATVGVMVVPIAPHYCWHSAELLMRTNSIV